MLGLTSTHSGSSSRLQFARCHSLRAVHTCAVVGRNAPAYWQSNTLVGLCSRPILLRTTRSASKQVLAKAKRAGKKVEESPYSSTIQLPTTEFSLRANSVVREPEIQRYWAEQNVYEEIASKNTGDAYTLHDGPPYANGDLHMGHALNKVLKDFINRYKLLKGMKARFIPGWDTHGLPIELKVLQSLSNAERKELTPLTLRRKAKDFAVQQIDSQRNQFKRYGVWADWDEPYRTLDPAYEAAQLEVFGQMVLNGHIYRGRKPVHWSPSSRTALAEAELEYPEGHTSHSIYVAMPITQVGSKVPQQVAKLLGSSALAIWTTTPWTIPANMAIAVNGDLEYSVIELQSEGGKNGTLASSPRLVVATGLVETVEAKLGSKAIVLATIQGSELEGSSYTHPLFNRTSPVVVGGDYITTESGTGLVHTAPGHGQEDFQVGQRYGLDILCPVDDLGNFTSEAGPFMGLNVLGEGNTAVITALRESGVLLKEEAYKHKYPYDWRTKKPTIFRATSQWFASVQGFREAALEAAGQVQWIPSSGLNRILAMTESRTDWCISRQRSWGVPIPVFYHKDSGEPLLTSETINYVRGLVTQHGSDVWWERSVEELLPPSLRHMAPDLVKGQDTMDVWFDSGSSWAGVLKTRQGLNFPADLYLEGSDQHRGWFQSSLLTSVAANGMAPYRSVLTHGFVLDEKGMKMSKSLGNVVDPRTVIEGGKDQKKQPPYGADVLRLWVGSVDYSTDVLIGNNVLRQVSELYRKLRGTIRFMLGSLSDFNPAQHTVPCAELPSMDCYILSRHAALMEEVNRGYEAFQFFRVLQAVQRFVIVDLSSFYLDAAKDRLYIRSTSDPDRRSCQTVLKALLEGLLAAISPMAPHLAEDAWLNLPYPSNQPSVFAAGWPTVPAEWQSGESSQLGQLWSRVLAIRTATNATMESARNAKAIGASLEAQVVVCCADEGLRDELQELQASSNEVDKLRYCFIVSQVTVTGDVELLAACPHRNEIVVEGCGAVTVGVKPAGGHKCARCWNFSVSLGTDPAHPELCERCTPIIQQMGFQVPKPAGATVALA